MSLLFVTGLETHPTGTFNKNPIINGNWQIIENIFDPAHVGPQAGVLQAALAGMTTIPYAGSVNLDLLGSRNMNYLALTGNVIIAATNKAAGRKRRIVIVADATDRSVAWPVGAVWSGPAVTTVLAGTTAVVDVDSTSTTDAALVLSSPTMAGTGTGGMTVGLAMAIASGNLLA